MFVQAIKPVGIITSFGVIAGFMHMFDGEAQPESHQLSIELWDEVVPFEQTLLSSQVSRHVEYIASSFAVGGLVRKGESLFSLEVADFKSTVVNAEADLAAQIGVLSQKSDVDKDDVEV